MDLNVLVLAGCSALRIDLASLPPGVTGLEWARLLAAQGLAISAQKRLSGVKRYPPGCVKWRPMMNWLMDYWDDLLALEEARADVFPIGLTDDQQIESFANDLKTVFAPMEDGSLDPGDRDDILNRWWQKLGALEMAAAKKEVAIQHRLVPLYQRLEQGTEVDWEEYARLRIRAHLNSRPMQAFMQSMAKSNATVSQIQADLVELKKLLGSKTE
jgi:hypothetical protein